MTYFPYAIFFCFSLILGSILAISSSSWVLIWAGLEINILSFIPIIVISSTESHTEAAIKYFLAQSLGSGFILLGGLGIYFFTFSLIPIWLLQLLLIIGLIIKLGVPPCHLWFPAIISFIRWPLCFLLSTWQKVVPLFILFSAVGGILPQLFILIIVLSRVVRAIGGISQTQLKPLLAYSSIGHMSWIIAASILSLSLSFIYFIIYVIIRAPLITALHLNRLNSIKSLSSALPLSLYFLPLLLIIVLSLGGVPPLIGFFPKWIVIQLASSFRSIIVLILIVGAIINLFYYLNIIFVSFSSSSVPLFNSYIEVSPLNTIIILSTSFTIILAPILILL